MNLLGTTANQTVLALVLRSTIVITLFYNLNEFIDLFYYNL